jgi:hypothetical protein
MPEPQAVLVKCLFLLRRTLNTAMNFEVSISPSAKLVEKTKLAFSMKSRLSCAMSSRVAVSKDWRTTPHPALSRHATGMHHFSIDPRSGCGGGTGADCMSFALRSHREALLRVASLPTLQECLATLECRPRGFPVLCNVTISRLTRPS